MAVQVPQFKIGRIPSDMTKQDIAFHVFCRSIATNLSLKETHVCFICDLIYGTCIRWISTLLPPRKNLSSCMCYLTVAKSCVKQKIHSSVFTNTGDSSKCLYLSLRDCFTCIVIDISIFLLCQSEICHIIRNDTITNWNIKLFKCTIRLL